MSRAPFRLACEELETRSLLSAGLSSSCGCGVRPTLPDQVVTPRIVNGTPTSQFPSVGTVGDRSGGFCSGTLIGPRHVLTAAHCSEGLGQTAGRFRVGGVTYSTSRIVIHPNYRPNAIGTNSANDIAVWELSRPVSGVTPSPIYRDVPRVGDVLTLVGFGAGGNGNTGHDGSYGTKRVGTTPIDGVTTRLIRWEFENSQESNTAPGDSGGPAFIQVGGTYYVAGVTSGGDRANAGYGDSSYDTRVDAYASWIDSITGQSGGGGGGGTTPPPPGDDHGNSIGSATPIAMGYSTGSATGGLDTTTDVDYFSFVPTWSGTTTIRLNATSNGFDPMLTVYDSAGRQVAFNDDSGSGLNSMVRPWLTAGETYYVKASGYRGSTGSYEVKVGSGWRTRKVLEARKLLHARHQHSDLSVERHRHREED